MRLRQTLRLALRGDPAWIAVLLLSSALIIELILAGIHGESAVSHERILTITFFLALSYLTLRFLWHECVTLWGLRRSKAVGSSLVLAGLLLFVFIPSVSAYSGALNFAPRRPGWETLDVLEPPLAVPGLILPAAFGLYAFGVFVGCIGTHAFLAGKATVVQVGGLLGLTLSSGLMQFMDAVGDERYGYLLGVSMGALMRVVWHNADALFVEEAGAGRQDRLRRARVSVLWITTVATALFGVVSAIPDRWVGAGPTDSPSSPPQYQEPPPPRGG